MSDDVFDARGALAGLSPSESVAVIGAAEESLVDAPLAALSEDGLLESLESREHARRTGVAVDAALFVEIADRGACRRAGYNTMHQLLTQGLRIGEGESKRRRVVAASIGRFTAMTGERRDPRFPATAQAVAEGAVGETHVSVIEEVMDKIPATVEPEKRAKAEAMLADAARTLNPAGVTMVGNRLLAHLDPDGALADDADRQRQAKFRLCAQDRQSMTAVQGRLTPQLRAEFEVMFTQWAAPGMNDPNDPDSPHGAARQAQPWNGKNPSEWESTVLTDGPDKGRVGWRPVGRAGPWIVNPLFHPDKLRTGPDVPAAERTPPPTVNHRLGDTTDEVSTSLDRHLSRDLDLREDSGRPVESGVEALLEHLLAA